MTVQYSIQKMVSDGTLSTVALGIQYIHRNDIYMRIAGEETPQVGAPSGYTWSFINNTTLKILPVVPNGVEVVVYRRTDVDAMYNIYSQNAQFDESSIDENNKQLLYIAQEYLEQGIPGVGVESVEFVRQEGALLYYRIKLTDGSYTPEFTIPSGDSVLRGTLSSNWADDSGLSINITDTPLLPSSADNRIKWERSRASLRAGVRDTVPLDDPMSHFRGLLDKNTWSDPAYHGVGSLSFGRNGAAYAYLSATLGHDCISYGVAALAGGAGSCTGNPDIPGDGANYGYCSIGWGKYSQALGRISYAFGEECISGSLNSVAMGWKSKTGPCVAGMPNPIGAGPVLSEGRAATALGHYVEAYGDGATAIGHYSKCYNGAMTFGYGINTGSPIVNAIPGAVGLAANSDVMGVQVTPGPGTNGGFSRIGFNTLYPNQRMEAMLKNTDKVAFRLDEGETGATLSLQRTVGGVISDVVSITFNNSGIGALFINGQQVVSNRASAIGDNLTIENKVQGILETLRYHGLIAS